MDIKTPTGITAYDIARIYDHQSVVDYFDLWIKESNLISKILDSSNKLTSTETKECPVCLEKRPARENWGLLHGDTIHIGFCETCTKILESNCGCERQKCSNRTCLKCRAPLERVIEASQVKIRQVESCCLICEEELHNEIWGFLHGDSMHFGYCKICANKLNNSEESKCPHCCCDIENVLRVYN